eukprot:1543537-Amphidinium_carterae.1
MWKFIKQTGCSLQDIKKAYDNYHDGPPGQQQPLPTRPKIPQKMKNDKGSQSLFDRSDDICIHASTRASYKKYVFCPPVHPIPLGSNKSC